MKLINNTQIIKIKKIDNNITNIKELNEDDSVLESLSILFNNQNNFIIGENNHFDVMNNIQLNDHLNEEIYDDTICIDDFKIHMDNMVIVNSYDQKITNDQDYQVVSLVESLEVNDDFSEDNDLNLLDLNLDNIFKIQKKNNMDDILKNEITDENNDKYNKNDEDIDESDNEDIDNSDNEDIDNSDNEDIDESDNEELRADTPINAIVKKNEYIEDKEEKEYRALFDVMIKRGTSIDTTIKKKKRRSIKKKENIENKKHEKFIQEQKEAVGMEKYSKNRDWIDEMEERKRMIYNDQILASKILVKEAFRRNPNIKNKYGEICNEIFQSNFDPNTIRLLLSRLKLFSDPEKIKENESSSDSGIEQLDLNSDTSSDSDYDLENSVFIE
jgi:hypothetical protein